MGAERDILFKVRTASAKRRLYLPHALWQMARPDRMISSAEVRAVIERGTIIEDYPEDPRGHSCLMLGFGEDGRAVHVVCAPKAEYLAIITAYLPDEGKWGAGYSRRRER